jgi:hypothetical protein
LLNWKHGHSDWVELKQTKPLQFAVAAIPTPRFPSYTPQELEAAVLSELKTWGEDNTPAERATWLVAPFEYPKQEADACIGTSQNSFRRRQSDG